MNIPNLKLGELTLQIKGGANKTRRQEAGLVFVGEP
jgi:hypothetical protein